MSQEAALWTLGTIAGVLVIIGMSLIVAGIDEHKPRVSRAGYVVLGVAAVNVLPALTYLWVKAIGG